MGSRRTTFEKLQRERDKKAKAAAKRERRQQRAANAEAETSGDDALATTTAESDDSAGQSAAELLERLEAIHKQFDADEISHEELEEQKSEIFARLALLPAE